MIIISGELLNSGVDYITLTQVYEEDTEGELWGIGVGKVSSLVEASGESARDVKFGGYSGYMDAMGGIKVGQRNREGFIDVMLQVSGAMSKVFWGQEDVVGIATAKGGKMTRLDEQVTVILDRPDRYLVADHYESILRSKAAGWSLCGRRSATLYRSANGDTLYVGKRGKGDMYRIYDKSEHYGYEPGVVWRFEVQRGRDTAIGSASVLKKEVAPDTWARLSSEFTKAAGISFVPWSKIAISYNADDLRDTAPGSYTKAYMNWLRRCVAPGITRISGSVDMVDLAHALGIKLGNLDIDSK